MSELVAPYSRKHLYLVLHQYNSTSKPVLARAQVVKDSSFFPASSSTYIAAEAFRISLFGNPESGYVYQYVSPEWFIAADVDDTTRHLNTRVYSDCNLLAKDYDLRPDTENWVTFCGHMIQDPLRWNDETAELGTMYTSLAGEFNDYRCSTDAIMNIASASDSQKGLYVKLLDKPSLYLRGPGMGRNGLGWMHGIISTITPDPRFAAEPLFRDDDDIVALFQCDYRVKIDSLPDDTTLNDFAVYMSSGINFYQRNH